MPTGNGVKCLYFVVLLDQPFLHVSSSLLLVCLARSLVHAGLADGQCALMFSFRTSATLQPLIWNPYIFCLLQYSEFVGAIITHFRSVRHNLMNEFLFGQVMYCHEPLQISRRSVEPDILMCFSQTPNQCLEGETMISESLRKGDNDSLCRWESALLSHRHDFRAGIQVRQ